MSPGFEAGSDDGIHAGVLKCCTLFGCGRRANCHDAFCPALFQDFAWGNPVDETEQGYPFIQQDADLILKLNLRIGLILRARRPQGCDMDSEWRQAPVKRVFIRLSSAPSSSVDTHK